MEEFLYLVILPKCGHKAVLLGIRPMFFLVEGIWLQLQTIDHLKGLIRNCNATQGPIEDTTHLAHSHSISKREEDNDMGPKCDIYLLGFGCSCPFLIFYNVLCESVVSIPHLNLKPISFRDYIIGFHTVHPCLTLDGPTTHLHSLWTRAWLFIGLVSRPIFTGLKLFIFLGSSFTLTATKPSTRLQDFSLA